MKKVTIETTPSTMMVFDSVRTYVTFETPLATPVTVCSGIGV